MAYGRARQRLVICAGHDVNFLEYDDTWEWDGTHWTDRTPASGPLGKLVEFPMVYHAARQRVMLFGGYELGPFLSDTLVGESDHAAQLDPFGAGCQGSGGVPKLEGPDRLPWIDDTFDLRVTNAGIG